MSLDRLKSQLNIRMSACDRAHAIVEIVEQLRSHCNVFGAAFSVEVSGAADAARLYITVDMGPIDLALGAEGGAVSFAHRPPAAPDPAPEPAPNDPGFGEDHGFAARGEMPVDPVPADPVPADPVPDAAEAPALVAAPEPVAAPATPVVQDAPPASPVPSAAFAAPDITDADARADALMPAGPYAGRLPAKWPMTPAEQAQVRAMLGRNCGDGEIAEAIGRDPRGFYHALKRAMASPAPTPPAPTAQPPNSLSTADARVAQRLAALPRISGWVAGDDLALVHDLSQGRKLAEIAIDLGLEVPALRARYAALCPAGGIEEQVQVLRVLRAMAASQAA